MPAPWFASVPAAALAAPPATAALPGRPCGSRPGARTAGRGAEPRAPRAARDGAGPRVSSLRLAPAAASASGGEGGVRARAHVRSGWRVAWCGAGGAARRPSCPAPRDAGASGRRPSPTLRPRPTRPSRSGAAAPAPAPGAWRSPWATGGSSPPGRRYRSGSASARCCCGPRYGRTRRRRRRRARERPRTAPRAPSQALRRRRRGPGPAPGSPGDGAGAAGTGRAGAAWRVGWRGFVLNKRAVTRALRRPVVSGGRGGLLGAGPSPPLPRPR